MNTIDWTSFTRKIAIKAPIHVLYDAWTKAVEIEKWFLSSAVFYDATGVRLDASASVTGGGTYEWGWYLFDTIESGTMLVADGRRNIRFTFAGECIVAVSLQPQGDYVVVELTQQNIPTDEASKKNIRMGCDSGWSFYLVNLKAYYESGVDLRNKDEQLTGMLNN